jgi:hypothetical protein
MSVSFLSVGANKLVSCGSTMRIIDRRFAPALATMCTGPLNVDLLPV